MDHGCNRKVAAGAVSVRPPLLASRMGPDNLLQSGLHIRCTRHLKCCHLNKPTPPACLTPTGSQCRSPFRNSVQIRRTAHSTSSDPSWKGWVALPEYLMRRKQWAPGSSRALLSTGWSRSFDVNTILATTPANGFDGKPQHDDRIEPSGPSLRRSASVAG